MFGKKSFKRIEAKSLEQTDNIAEEDIPPRKRVKAMEEDMERVIRPAVEEDVQEIERETREYIPQPKKEIKEKTIVVKELPTQEVRRIKLEDGSIANLITIEEALTAFYEQFTKENNN